MLGRKVICAKCINCSYNNTVILYDYLLLFISRGGGGVLVLWDGSFLAWQSLADEERELGALHCVVAVFCASFSWCLWDSLGRNVPYKNRNVNMTKTFVFITRSRF